jgi:hypothetical protein
MAEEETALQARFLQKVFSTKRFVSYSYTSGKSLRTEWTKVKSYVCRYWQFLLNETIHIHQRINQALF